MHASRINSIILLRNGIPTVSHDMVIPPYISDNLRVYF